jgi:hypothetical protein
MKRPRDMRAVFVGLYFQCSELDRVNRQVCEEMFLWQFQIGILRRRKLTEHCRSCPRRDAEQRGLFLDALWLLAQGS